MPSALSNRLDQIHGSWLVLIGVLIISPDALLIRLIETDDITASFWRVTLLATALLIAALWRGARRRQNFLQSIMPTKAECCAGVFYGGTSALFILSVRNTDAANTLVIIAATPILAGLIGMFIFKRGQPLRTWVASLVVVVALALIVGAGFGGENALGDFLALCTALCMACFFNVVGVYPQIDAVKAMLLGAVLAALALAPGATPLAVGGLDPLWLFLLGFWVLPFSFVFITAGAKKIPASEAGLIMLNEAIFGSFLVWVFIGEVPTQTTLICGTVVIATLAIHSFLALRDRQKSARKRPPANAQ